MLLGVGLLAQAAAFIFFDLNAGRISDRGALVYDGTIIYLALQAIAYLLIAVSYARRAEGVKGAVAEVDPILAAAPYTLLLFGTRTLEFGELVLVVIVGVVAFQALLVYANGGNRQALMVLGAFAAILVAHIANLSAALLSSGLLYLIGDLVQLAGFGLLLLFVLRSGPVVAK